MKSVGVFFCLLFCIQNVLGQTNLVPNSSFEDTLGCPSGISQINKTKFWFNPVPVTTPDFFHACATISVGIPNNTFGSQGARTGNAYAGIHVFNRDFPNDGREYIEIKLVDSLRKDSIYLVTIFVSLADKPNYAISTIGVFFSKDSVYSISPIGYLDSIPQIENQVGNPLQDSLVWAEIKDTLFANGGEKYITIGNFRPDSLCDTLFQHEYMPSWRGAYYYIDDVSVIRLDTTDTTGIGIKNTMRDEIKISPNPFTSEIILQLENVSGEKEVVICNLMGVEIKRDKIPINQKQFKFNLEYLPPGVYFLSVRSENAHVAKKIVKI